jgi:hypothetical protein
MNHPKICVLMIAACVMAPLVAVAQAATPVKPITHQTLWQQTVDQQVTSRQDRRHAAPRG